MAEGVIKALCNDLWWMAFRFETIGQKSWCTFTTEELQRKRGVTWEVGNVCDDRACDEKTECVYFIWQKVSAVLKGTGNIIKAAEACYNKGGTAGVSEATLRQLPPKLRMCK